MARNVIGRSWDRLVDRYEQESDADCCETTIDEVSSDETEEDSESAAGKQNVEIRYV